MHPDKKFQKMILDQRRNTNKKYFKLRYLVFINSSMQNKKRKIESQHSREIGTPYKRGNINPSLVVGSLISTGDVVQRHNSCSSTNTFRSPRFSFCNSQHVNSLEKIINDSNMKGGIKLL